MSTHQNKGTVVLVDDDAGILEVMQIILEEEGYNVQTTYDGQALELVEKHKPNLLLLDIWMSGMNGGDICKQLKSQPSTKDIPIILVSANRDTKEIAKKAGADDFITKPFDIEDLLQRVEKHMKCN